MDAKKFIDNAESILPGLEVAAQLTGIKVLISIVSVLRRATQNPTTKAILIEWLRYTPMFTGTKERSGNSQPLLPDVYANLYSELEEFRAACTDPT